MKIFVILFFLAACTSWGVEGLASVQQASQGTSASALDIIRDSGEASELLTAAIKLASSDSAGDHEALGKELRSSAFLARLDDKEKYTGSIADLRLTRLLDTLAANRTPSVDKVLLSLAQDSVFQAHPLRMILVVRALSSIRPSPLEAIHYWDSRSEPDSPLLLDIIEAICTNQSPPALELLDKKMAGVGYAVSERIFWMRKLILPRRNDAPLLAACERMLMASLPESLRPALVEVLFDYQPSKWYRGDDPPKPPPRSEMAPEARKILERIGRFSLDKIKLTGEQEKKVRTVLSE
jgi:hypothetical protein